MILIAHMDSRCPTFLQREALREMLDIVNYKAIHYMVISWNGGSTQIIHFNGILHYKPSILGVLPT